MRTVGTARVDEFIDGVGIVCEVGCEVGGGGGVGVVGDERAEVGCYAVGCNVIETGRGAADLVGVGEDTECQCSEGDEGGAHVCDCGGTLEYTEAQEETVLVCGRCV